TLNRVALWVNVVDMGSLILSRVGNINRGVFRIWSDVNALDASNIWGVTVNCRNINCNPAVVAALCPAGVGNLVVYQINCSATFEAGRLFSSVRSFTRLSDVNRPGNGLVQIILSNTTWVVLTVWQLITRVLWLIWRNRDRIVFDLNSNSWDTIRTSNHVRWNVLTFHDLPVSWRLWVNFDMVASLTSQISVTNYIATIITINVENLTSLGISRVGNVNINILLTISNGYCINLSLRNSITSMNWCIIFSPVCSICWPVSVSYITSYFINGCITEDLSSLRNLLSSLAWFMNRDRPRNRLVQVSFMGAINHFGRDCRPILIHWLRVIHISDDMTQMYINRLIIITNLDHKCVM